MMDQLREFMDDVTKYMSVMELNAKYSAQDVGNFVSLYDRKLNLVTMIWQNSRGDKIPSIEWQISYLTWLFEKCNYPVNCIVGTYEDYDGKLYNETILDWVCFMISLRCHRLTLMKLLMKYGAKSYCGLGKHLLHTDSEEECYLLLDAGAKMDSQEIYDEYVIRLYHSRLAARAACRALLSCGRRGVLRGIIARELWRDMAERVWAQRFEFK